MRAQTIAHEKGYSQVLWLDGVEKKYVGEVGAMNIFFVIDGEVITPELDGSIHHEKVHDLDSPGQGLQGHRAQDRDPGGCGRV